MNGPFCPALLGRAPAVPLAAAPLPAEPPGAVPFLLFPGPAAAYAGLLPCAPGRGGYDGALEPGFVQKRNERERQRVRCVNEGYARLRGHLPGARPERRLSKVETLRAAIRYIRHLQDLLRAAPERPGDAPAPEDPGGAPVPGLAAEEPSQ